MVEDNSLVPQKAKVGECIAMTHSGEVCGQPVAMAGMDFCINHMPKFVGAGNRSKGYEEQLPDVLKEDFGKQIKDMNAVDLSAEIALSRTILISMNHILKNKIELTQQKGEPIEEEEFNRHAAKIVSIMVSLRQLVDSQARLSPTKVITIQKMKDVISKFVVAIREEVYDLETKKRILLRLQNVTVEMQESVSEYVAGENLPKDNMP